MRPGRHAFLMLPLLCLTNSCCMDERRFAAILRCVEGESCLLTKTMPKPQTSHVISV